MNPRPDNLYDVYEARIAALEARLQSFEAQLEREARTPARFDLTYGRRNTACSSRGRC